MNNPGSDSHPQYLRLEYDFSLDETLGLEIPARGPEIQSLCHQVEPVAGNDSATEPDVVHGCKPEEVGVRDAAVVADRAKLGTGFQHDHSRQERAVGQVAFDPELLVGHVLVSRYQLFVTIDVDDSGEVLHIVPLRIHLPDILDAVLNLLVHEKIEIKEGLGTHFHVPFALGGSGEWHEFR